MSNYFGFGLKTKLSWHNDKLQLEISDRFGNLWFFDALKPETYQLRFSYDIPDGTASCYDPDTMRLRTIEGIQPGRGVTQFIKLRLVETIPTDNNAIEVDGVRFKIEMPKSVLTIPANQPGATTSVKLGMRITNNTSTLLYFRRISSIYPTLIGQDGQPVERDTDTFRLSSPTSYSVQPGESALFLLNATLSWKDNKLQLAIPNESNGFWYFRGLKNGAYQLRFIYKGYDSVSMETELRLELPGDLWKGWIAMHPVEIYLVQH